MLIIGLAGQAPRLHSQLSFNVRRHTVRSRYLIATIVVILAACSEASNGTGSISKSIGAAARYPGASEVNLSKLTSFGWDKFYVFKPGTTREQVCSFIGANRNQCGRIIRVPNAPEGHVFMIFGLGSQLTHVEMHSLENGQFDVNFPDAGLPKAAAVFTVSRSTSGSSEVIRLQPK